MSDSAVKKIKKIYCIYSNLRSIHYPICKSFLNKTIKDFLQEEAVRDTLYKTTKRCFRRTFMQREAPPNHNADEYRWRGVLLICGSHSNNVSKEKMDSYRIHNISGFTFRPAEFDCFVT